MNAVGSETRTVVVEREIPFPPDRIWRALTEPHLIAEWLMQNDFAPVVDRHFSFRAAWGAVDCRVIEIEPQKSLSYTWQALGLDSVVTWTLTPTGTGTHLRMEQSGFRRDQAQAYAGAKSGWLGMLAALEGVVAKLSR